MNLDKDDKDYLDNLLKQQFRQDTELASPHLPHPNTVMLQAQAIVMLKSQKDKHHKSVSPVQNTYTLTRLVPIAFFFLFLIVLILFQGIDLSAIKIFALGSIIIAWVLDRIE